MLTNDLTAQAIDHANAILGHLTEHMASDWSDAISELSSDAEYATAIGTIRRRLHEAHLAEPCGVLREGTGVFSVRLGMTGEDVQRAIRLLKDALRIVQVGRGRGKAIVVLQTKPLTLHEFEVAEAPAAVVDSGDVPTLLRRVRDAYVENSKQLSVLKQANALKADRIVELESEVQELRQRIDHLQTQAAQTWS